MLGPADVGQRVVVRRIVRKAEDGRPLFGDLIGELVEVGDEHLVLRDRNGVHHRVARDVLVGGKRVPPPPVTGRGIAALERVAAQGWPAPDTEFLGEWLLRAADGWTNRANSALAVGDPGLPLPDAVDAVVAWYRRRGLTPRITTPLPLATALADTLAARGWTAQPTTLVQTVDLAAVPAVDGLDVHLPATPSEAWLAAAAGHKGTMPAVALQILTAPAEVRFAEVYADGGEPDGRTLLGNARGVLTDRWLGISLVHVTPTARRTGLARRMVHSLAAWARQAGATRAYLQVERDNAPAVALYAGLGFVTHHTYVTWRG